MLLKNPNDAVLREISKGNLKLFKKATEEFLEQAKRVRVISPPENQPEQPAQPLQHDP